METANEKIARLDMAARALISERYISRNRWLFLFTNLVLGEFVFAYSTRFDSALIAPIFAVCAAVATVALWTDWRYKIYVLAFFCLLLTMGCALLGRAFDTLSDRLYGIGMSIVFGLASWKQAGPYAIANAPGWETERSQVEAWWWKLTSPERANDIIEFSAGNFWTGHYTYRLMDVESGWAVARLWKGIGRILPNFRIRELSAVTFASLPTGEKRVTVGGRTTRAFNLVTPELTDTNSPIIPKSA
jgi:hypothetical protein